ncbi:MAG: hypothetical protein JW931_08625 [Methanomicrobiaceae archaeon]|nr:hypothetical protein [Methanomicrobiaceae archaeon]
MNKILNHLSNKQVEKVCHYIEERKCISGGFCFYKLDHPNAADTFHAMHSLKLLGRDYSGDKTLRFLLSLQREDGSYPSVQAALYTNYCLSFLGEEPLYDMGCYLKKINLLPSKNSGNPEIMSFLEPVYSALALYRLKGSDILEESADSIRSHISGLEKISGNGCTSYGSLIDTFYSIMILKLLGDNPPMDKTEDSLKSFSDREYGFVPGPGRKPAYIEHVHAGLFLSSLIKKDINSEICRNFIERCAHSSGGYVRSVYGGSPSLEYTGLAIESLYMLNVGEVPDIYLNGCYRQLWKTDIIEHK